jgi:hypothetical protein
MNSAIAFQQRWFPTRPFLMLPASQIRVEGIGLPHADAIAFGDSVGYNDSIGILAGAASRPEDFQTGRLRQRQLLPIKARVGMDQRRLASCSSSMRMEKTCGGSGRLRSQFRAKLQAERQAATAYRHSLSG